MLLSRDNRDCCLHYTGWLYNSIWVVFDLLCLIADAGKGYTESDASVLACWFLLLLFQMVRAAYHRFYTDVYTEECFIYWRRGTMLAMVGFAIWLLVLVYEFYSSLATTMRVWLLGSLLYAASLFLVLFYLELNQLYTHRRVSQEPA